MTRKKNQLNRSSKDKGFTLIELSVVLVVVALVLGGSLALGSAKVAAEKVKQTNDKIDVIIDNLRKYISTGGTSIANGVPCPSAPAIASTEAAFGIANCAGAGVITYSSGSTALRVGAVPVRTIYLPDEYAFDAWGNKFTWIMDTRYNTGVQLNSTLGTTNDIIQIRPSAAGAAITTNAIFFILSHGPNGHGAWKKAAGNRINKASADADERENTHCGADIVTECSTNNIFITKAKTATYDDITAYRMRWQLIPTALSGGVITNPTPACNRPYPSSTGAVAAMTAYDIGTCGVTPRRCMPLAYGSGNQGLYNAPDVLNFENLNANLSGIGNDIPVALSSSTVLYLCVAPDGSSLLCGATLSGTTTSDAPGTTGGGSGGSGGGVVVTQTRYDHTPNTNNCFWFQF